MYSMVQKVTVISIIDQVRFFKKRSLNIFVNLHKYIFLEIVFNSTNFKVAVPVQYGSTSSYGKYH